MWSAQVLVYFFYSQVGAKDKERTPVKTAQLHLLLIDLLASYKVNPKNQLETCSKVQANVLLYL